MKILIVNHYDCRNKGDHSVLSAMLESLKKSFPKSEIIVLSHYPRSDRVRCDATVIESLILPSPGMHAKLTTFWGMVRCIVWILFARYFGIGINKLIPADKKRAMLAYAKADVVLARSTDWFNDIYSGTFITAFYEVLIAVLLRKKTVIYAQTIGPISNNFKGKVYRFALKMLLKRVDLIMIRDEFSKRFLQSIGLTHPNIYVTADPAFSLRPSPRKRAHEIFKHEATFKCYSSALVGINISRLIYRHCFPKIANLKEKYDQFIKMMAEFIDNIVERFNVAVVLIPHVFGTETRDDRKACKDVFEMVKNKERVVMIQNEYSPEELRSLIGMCQLFIGMRMHAIISALSMHVPTIGIDYSGKVLGIMTMVDQDKLVCHAKTLNLNELWKKFEFVYQYRDEIRTTLKLRVKVLRKRSTMNIILLQKLLVSTHSRLAANFEEYCAKPYD